MDRDSNKQQSSTQRFDCPVNAADTNGKWLLTGFLKALISSKPQQMKDFVKVRTILQ